MTKEQQRFQKKVWKFYFENKREFPWRKTTDPYKVLVSEIMLQQTQTLRVIEKYNLFTQAFPSFETLANVTQTEVLKFWQGLGYNRRALYLKRTAEIVSSQCNGKLPLTQTELTKLPGIGINTAGAVIAFAYNKPVVFIETNIRRVYLHEFFKEEENVSDKEIIPLIESTLPKRGKITPREEQQRSRKAGSEFTSEGASRNPEGVSRDVREWYYALMDYGAYLGKTIVNPNRKSKHYTKQSKFEGSLRQIRGGILKILVDGPRMLNSLQKEFGDEQLFNAALEGLTKEGFVENINEKIRLKA